MVSKLLCQLTVRDNPADSFICLLAETTSVYCDMDPSNLQVEDKPLFFPPLQDVAKGTFY